MEATDAVKVETLDVGPQKRVNESHRFLLIAIGALCCICTSFSYAFNLISGTMQQRYGLNQRELVTIATLGIVFMFFALPYAFIFDYFGPLPVSVLAIIFFPVGTVCLALCFMGKIHGTVARLSVFNALMGAGCIQFDLISLMSTISYFPSNKGPVTALLKTFTGLGQALVGTMYIGYFSKKPDIYFFFLMAFAIVVGILAIIFLRLPAYHMTGYEMKKLSTEEKEKREKTKAQFLRQKPPMWRFAWGFTIIIILIIFLPVQSAMVAYNYVTDKKITLAFAIVATILLVIFLLLWIPVPSCFTRKGKRTQENSQEEDFVEDDIDDHIAQIEMGEKGTDNRVEGEGSAEPIEKVEKPVETEVDYIAPQYQGTFLRNLLTPELWSLFWSFFVIVGAEFVIIFNAAYVFSALHGSEISPELRSLLTVLNGVGSAVGRLVMSVFEIWTQKRKAEDRIPITISLFPPTVSVLLSLILFLVLPAQALPFAFILIALGNGFINASIVLSTRTIYAKDSAKHYNFCFLAMAIAGIVFNRGLYGEWYAKEAEKQGSDLVCLGRECVQTPIIILICLSATAFATNVFSHLRYRNLCIKVMKERARIRNELTTEASEEPIYEGEEQKE
ncbi:Major Facilitator Superfamily/Nodulin-like, putative [Angomonas deanei]|uniref:Major Facilitator Superfamily/Nodulin-like, putative n=1 Tax=Angomonas deanei TaxID=59799 RepID=A0A7G2CUE5_9TRYP|nr:Major Facilitator Superfamily/Nodulin-like, putative [Angomonas deanei]